MLARTILALALLRFAAAKPLASVPGASLPLEGEIDGYNVARNIFEDSEMNDLAKRRRGPNGCKTDCISSCGKGGNGPWVPVQFPHGYTATYNKFCAWAATGPDGGPTVLGPGGRISLAWNEVDMEDGTNPSGEKSPDISVGWIDFEIHNKQKTSYTVKAHDCNTFFGKMADPTDSPCYGSLNDDTMGGTYQIGANLVTFHAFPAFGSA